MITLLRHGEIKGGTRFRGSTDDPLTPKGFQQMRAATQDPFRCDLVISSPLIRCAAFASELTLEKTASLRIEPRLAEMHFGEWEGCTSKQIYDKSPSALEQFWSDPQKYPPPGGERLLDFRDRVLAAWEDLTYSLTHKHILLVTHGGVIRILMCHLQDIPLSKIMEIVVGYGALRSFRPTGNGHFERVEQN